MKVNLPAKARKAIYITNLFVTPAVMLLVQQTLIPSWVGLLWGVEIAAAMALAGLNVNPDD